MAKIVLTILATCLWTSAQAEWHSDEQPIMGTSVRVEIWLEDEAKASALVSDAMSEMQRIDAAFSTHRDSSELSRLNREAPFGWVNVSDELLDLLARAAYVSKISGGAFDVTYASVGRYYDYRAGEQPSEAERAAVAAIDYRHVDIDQPGGRVRYLHPQTYVDLGGIAKGHAVDRVTRLLSVAGVAHGSVSAGGDSRIIGDRRGQPWRIGVQDPRRAGAMAAVLPLVDVAVSTSGDYERFFERDGVRYHHILDPGTGESARGAMSVTVIGDDATFNDALSTTIFVMGAERGLQFANTLPGVDVIVIDAGGSLRFSDGLAQLRTGGHGSQSNDG